MTRTCCPHLDKEYLFPPTCLTNEALLRAPTGDTEGVNAKKMRNKKKAFAAMALVALATPQATAIADSSLFGRWWSSAFRLTTPIFVARGPALLFGISRWLSQHGISRKRRNNLTRVLIAVERSTQESKANSSHPSSREGHRCAGLSLRQFGVRRSDCRRHFPCPAELGSITPHAMHNHGEPSCQCDDGFFLPPTLGNVHRPCLQPRPFLHAGQHDLRGLIEQRSHGLVAT